MRKVLVAVKAVPPGVSFRASFVGAMASGIHFACAQSPKTLCGKAVPPCAGTIPTSPLSTGSPKSTVNRGTKRIHRQRNHQSGRRDTIQRLREAQSPRNDGFRGGSLTFHQKTVALDAASQESDRRRNAA